MSYMHNAIFVTSVSKLPIGEHWAIIEDTSIHHEADERSKMHPGHGYPAYSESAITYMAFEKYEDFEAEMTKKLAEKGWQRSFRGIHVKGQYTSEVSIHLRESNGSGS